MKAPRLAWSVTVWIVCGSLFVGCAGLREEKQRERERAAMRYAMNRAHTAQAESVRRSDSGKITTDWPRFIATLEGIDVARCPEDFRVAWDDVLAGFKAQYDASRRSVVSGSALKTAFGLWAAYARQDWIALAATLDAGASARADSRPDSEQKRRMERLTLVCERHGLKRLDRPAGAP